MINAFTDIYAYLLDRYLYTTNANTRFFRLSLPSGGSRSIKNALCRSIETAKGRSSMLHTYIYIFIFVYIYMYMFIVYYVIERDSNERDALEYPIALQSS